MMSNDKNAYKDSTIPNGVITIDFSPLSKEEKKANYKNEAEAMRLSKPIKDRHQIPEIAPVVTYANPLDIQLSDKHIDFILDQDSELDFLEGTVRASKTVIGLVKFGLKVADSPEQQWIIGGKDKSTVERNLLFGEFGLMNMFPNEMTYKPKGIGGAHIEFVTPNGIKQLYIVGYDDERRWKKILGMTLGGGFIDEINIASLMFIKMYLTRMASVDFPYTCCTANPDDPNLEVYKTLNKCYPLPEYVDKIPMEILAILNDSPTNSNWRYWHFTMNDNPAMSENKIDKLKSAYDVDDPFYKTHILGLRARAEGLVYRAFNYDVHVYQLARKAYQKLEIGLDYGQTKSAMSYVLVGFNFPKVEVLSEYWHKNALTNDKLDDVDYAKAFVKWVKALGAVYPDLISGRKKIKVRFDSASPAYAKMVQRYLKEAGYHHFSFYPSIKIPIVDRITLVISLLRDKLIRWDVSCEKGIDAMNSTVYDNKGVRRDDSKLDNIDSMDSLEYVLEPYEYKLLNPIRLAMKGGSNNES